MTFERDHISQSIALAAQADLLFLTEEMLRSPQKIEDRDALCWQEIPTATT